MRLGVWAWQSDGARQDHPGDAPRKLRRRCGTIAETSDVNIQKGDGRRKGKDPLWIVRVTMARLRSRGTRIGWLRWHNRKTIPLSVSASHYSRWEHCAAARGTIVAYESQRITLTNCGLLGASRNARHLFLSLSMSLADLRVHSEHLSFVQAMAIQPGRLLCGWLDDVTDGKRRWKD
jgi:hypothetical protein